MKTSAIVLGLSAIVATATAQSASIPACLSSCAQAIYSGAGCTNGDLKCLCTGASNGNIPSITSSNACASSAKTCSASDLKSWANYWSNACKPYIGQIAQTVANEAPTALAAASTALALATGSPTTLAASTTVTPSGTAATNPVNPSQTNAATSLKFESVGALAAVAALYLVV